MSDAVRKTIALLILVLGGALLWFVKSSSDEADAAKNHIDATIAEAREHAASQLAGTICQAVLHCVT